MQFFVLNELGRVFKNIAEGQMYVGKPRERWLGDFENYLKKVGVETGEN